MSRENNGTVRQRAVGAFASFYLGLAYLIGITIFIFILRYPEIESVAEKVKLVVDFRAMVFASNILLYVLFGPLLVVFILAIRSRLEDSQALLAGASTIVGYIWAGSLVAGGMIANAAIEPVLSLYTTNQDQAIRMWQILDIVSMGLGNGNGEILGGLFTLGFGLVFLREKRRSRIIGILGLVTGIVGIASTLPALKDLTGAFGMAQMLWFFAIGISFLRKRP